MWTYKFPQQNVNWTHISSKNVQLPLGYIFMVVEAENHLFPGESLMSSQVAPDWWL